MKMKIIFLVALVLVAGFAIGATLAGGASNFTRLVLGDDNFGTDPNTTADITGQNDEYISNYTNGAWDFGSANLTTTGTLSGGAIDLGSSYSKLDTFSAQATIDTISWTGVAATDFLMAQPNTTAVDTTDNLSAMAGTNQVFVYRKANGKANLPYKVIRFK